MSTIDLHVHTNISDGLHSPDEVVAMAHQAGLQTMAITDHDALDGVPAAIEAADGTGLRIIPGVEISCEGRHGDIHILGYFIDWRNETLRASLVESRDSRRGRALAMLDRLRALGIHLSWERVQELAGEGSIGRPHIAAALEEASYVTTIQEAFDRYLGPYGPAYVSRIKLPPRKAIALIHNASGVPVLAHPWNLELSVPALAEAGLAGLEAYYGGYSAEASTYLVRLAHRHGLICTGGSDFHGHALLPDRPLGKTVMPPHCLEELEALRPRPARLDSVG